MTTQVCVLPPTAAGARLFKADCYDIATNGFARAFVEAARVAVGCSAYLGDFRNKSALGKRPNIAILATARLMARITWQLLTQRRAYTRFETQYFRSQSAERIACMVGSAKEDAETTRFPFEEDFSPVAPK